MPSETPDPFFYPGTLTLRNRFGIEDDAVLEEVEDLAYSFRAESLPPRGFAPDMRGLKRVHRHLFGDVYEWAGYARHEPVVVDSRVIEPQEHRLRKGAVEFGSSELSRFVLPRELARRRDDLGGLRVRGVLTVGQWCKSTAEGIVMINWAHPFREGNGRAMRHYIECSAEYYGFGCTVPSGEKWVEVCERTRRSGDAQSFSVFLAELTSPRRQARPSPAATGVDLSRVMSHVAGTIAESRSSTSTGKLGK